MPTTPPPPPPADWPVGEPYPPDAVLQDTVIATGPPLPPPVAPPPVDPEPGNRIGLGMLLAIVFVAAIAAVLAAVYFTRDNGNNKGAAARTVFVTTSKSPAATPPASVPVPSLVGIGKADALTQLQRAGFKVTVATVSGSSPAGTVMAQNPPPGTSEPTGTAVRLNISSGTAGAGGTTTAAATTPAQPASASVPALSGDLRSALGDLNTAGFLVSVGYVPATSPLGTVVSQSPSGGATAPPGSHVTVNVSAGQSTATPKTIPDLTGKTVKDAVAALQAAGLRLVELKKPVTDPTQVGTVVEQSPAAGKTAPQNAQVLVYWGALQK